GSVVLDPALLPDGTVEEVEAKQAEILDGSFTVDVNDEEPKSSM
ncbi:MAG: BMP family ABC transporter substrate-binding protein, partial [Thalassospira sp.]|nr:BMP family ABC transporter substrate-binding protein [Thalassospira sp.]